MVDKNIRKAKERLTALSADPSIQELARMRQSAAHNWKNSQREAKEEGRQEGKEEGRQEGKEEGRQEARRELLTKLLQSDFGALKSPRELATLVGCTEEEVLTVKKSLTPETIGAPK